MYSFGHVFLSLASKVLCTHTHTYTIDRALAVQLMQGFLISAAVPLHGPN